MKIINAGYEIMQPLGGMAILKHVERIGQVCFTKVKKKLLTIVGYLCKNAH